MNKTNVHELCAMEAMAQQYNLCINGMITLIQIGIGNIHDLDKIAASRGRNYNAVYNAPWFNRLIDADGMVRREKNLDLTKRDLTRWKYKLTEYGESVIAQFKALTPLLHV